MGFNAEQFYNRPRTPGIPTIGNIQLSDTAGLGPITRGPGEIIVATTAGLKFTNRASVTIPLKFSFDGIAGLSTELRQKLERDRPASLGQAARLDGMTPAALLLLLAHLKKGSRWKTA